MKQLMVDKKKLSVQQKKGQKVLDTIYLKAWTDEVFKNELLRDPVRTLEKFFGKKFPSNKEIVVSDQSDPNCIYINIPIKPNIGDLELSKEEFEILYGRMKSKGDR